MTSNMELLPLPEDYDQNPAGNAEVQDYARACVAHATAARDTKIEALRAERDEARRDYFDAVNRLAPKADQAERLAEALREIEGIAAGSQTVNSLPRIGKIAHDTLHPTAAIDQARGKEGK